MDKYESLVLKADADLPLPINVQLKEQIKWLGRSMRMMEKNFIGRAEFCVIFISNPGLKGIMEIHRDNKAEICDIWRKISIMPENRGNHQRLWKIRARGWNFSALLAKICHPAFRTFDDSKTSFSS